MWCLYRGIFSMLMLLLQENKAAKGCLVFYIINTTVDKEKPEYRNFLYKGSQYCILKNSKGCFFLFFKAHTKEGLNL